MKRSISSKKFWGVIISLLGLASVTWSASWTQDQPAHSYSPAELRIRFAEIRLSIAENQLASAIAANQKVQGSIGEHQLSRHRSDVAVGRKLLELARANSGSSDTTSQHLARAKAMAELARHQYHRALEMPKRDLIYSEYQLEHLRLMAEMTQLRVDLWNTPNDSFSVIDQLQFQVEQLNEEVLVLKQQMSEFHLHAFQ